MDSFAFGERALCYRSDPLDESSQVFIDACYAGVNLRHCAL